MSTNILMPALSPTMTEGKLSRWLKKEGDEVKSGDVLAEIETDKATMEVEAVDEGYLAKIVVPDGTEGVAVNAVIAILTETKGEVRGRRPGCRTQGRSTESRSGCRAEPPLRHPPRPVPPGRMRRASSPRRSPGASPSRRASIWPPSRAPARMAGS